MSSRHYRKRVGNSSLPPPLEDDSDGDYQPLYSQRPTQSKYAGLVSSSQSESDRGSPEASDEDEGEQDSAAALPQPVIDKRKNLKKKGKGKGKKPLDDMDEIDRSVQEVNAILGAPPPAPEPQPKKENWALAVLRVDPRHLNVAQELRRLFGPEESDNRRMRIQPYRALLLKRIMVLPSKDTAMYDFKNAGLSMTKYKDVNERMYFVFNHDEAYQKMHRAFLVKFATAKGPSILMHLDEARKNMHVEALLEISDLLFRMEEHSVANEIVENVVTFLQYVAHPLFILSSTNVRLDYKFIENRPFHVAMLKYVYLLTNKACHRTALEIIKMMLIVDPNDPLALLSIIDTIALRAREYEWFIEVVKYFDKQREALILYNIKYSYALAHFHIALKKKQDMAEADRLLQDAILAHPNVLVKLLDCANMSVPRITNHKLFTKDPYQVGTPGVDELKMIFAKMNWPRWREPQVMDWLLKNASELCENYNKDCKVRETADDYTRCRIGDFQVWPPEYLRHISVLTSMSKLILDAPLTAFFRPTCAWDPLFDKGINRYDYKYHVDPPRNVGVSRSAVYSYDVRNEFLVALSQVSVNPNCMPYLSATAADYLNSYEPEEEDPRKVNATEPLYYDDDDSDYTNYDYDDDYDNFEHYDEDMAEAMAYMENLKMENTKPENQQQGAETSNN